MSLPILFKKDAKGKTRTFSIKAEGNLVISETGLEDGKKVQNTKVAIGKNKGKKNETSDEEQAKLEAQSQWNKKKEREGYHQKDEEQSPFISPCLLQTFDPEKCKFELEDAFVQPKIDGIHCISQIIDEKISMYSRSKNETQFQNHIRKELSIIFSENEKLILDGELYVHNPIKDGKHLEGKDRFNFITSTCSFGRSEKSEDEEQIEYHVFDLCLPDVPYKDRLNLLKEIIVPSFKFIKLVETRQIKDKDELEMLRRQFEDDGYEGIVIRNGEGLYKTDYRSPHILKYKSHITDECVILGKSLKEGSLDQSTFTWDCKFEEGTRTFSVTPFGTKEERLIQYRSWKKEGQKLTFKYQDKLNKKKDVPRFAIALAFRDYE
jgi:ATP-dependent DNA ligase